MKKLKVLVLMHEDLVPPDDIRTSDKKERLEFQTEWDVVRTLKGAGHEILKLGLRDEILPLRQAVEHFKPDIAFNLLEEFHGKALYDQHVVSYLELLRVPYTGCNPRGLVLARGKALSKKILHFHRVAVPGFAVFPIGRKVAATKRLKLPAIVKSTVEEASMGISQASVVYDDEELVERVTFVHERIKTDAIAEEYIEGRELYVGVMGTERLRVLPTWEMVFQKLPKDQNPIATHKVKWDQKYQKKHRIFTKAAKLPDALEQKVARLSKRIYRNLNLSGYARIDYRLNEAGEFYLLEANPNPNISKYEDFAASAKKGGIPYDKLLERIISIGLRTTAGRR